MMINDSEQLKIMLVLGGDRHAIRKCLGFSDDEFERILKGHDIKLTFLQSCCINAMREIIEARFEFKGRKKNEAH